MDALDEIKFRLESSIMFGSLDGPIDMSEDRHVANCHQMSANAWFTAYVYSRALNQPEALGYLDKADAFCQQAFDVYKPCQLYALSQMYLHAVMRQDDRRHELAKHIAIMAFDAEQKAISPMTLLTVSLVLNQHIERYLPELEKVEERKSDVVLPGSTAAAKAIINRDEAALVESLDTILVAQCKRAGNLRSDICIGSSNTLICRIAILLCDAARCNGLDVADKLTKRRQKLNLRLRSPADFPDIPRTVKFPIEVDFLTGEVFPKTGKK